MYLRSPALGFYYLDTFLTHYIKLRSAIVFHFEAIRNASKDMFRSLGIKDPHFRVSQEIHSDKHLQF